MSTIGPSSWVDVPELTLLTWRAIFYRSTEGEDLSAPCPVCGQAKSASLVRSPSTVDEVSERRLAGCRITVAVVHELPLLRAHLWARADLVACISCRASR